MRGKLYGDLRVESHTRNIPAYAGKTSKRKANTVTAAEHPRVCGENGYT